MNQYEATLLMIASRLLSYPTEEGKEEVYTFVNKIVCSDVKRKLVKDTVDAVYETPLQELRKTYVETFDLKTQLGMYLTAHEYADSPKRGAALIKLQNIIKEAGYDHIEGELVDYIPLLFEFIAVAQDNAHLDRLVNRLACTTQRILEHLNDENPYYPIVLHLMQFVFDAPTKEDMEKIDRNREEADLAELPYPIMYN